MAVLSAVPVFAQEDTTGTMPDALKEITFEANVVTLVLNDEHRNGVDWGAIVEDYHSVPLKKEDNPIWQDKKYRLSVGSVSDEDYAVLLDALDTVGQMSQYPQASFTVGVGAGNDVVFAHVPIHLTAYVTGKEGQYKLQLQPHVALQNNIYHGSQKIIERFDFKADTDVEIKDNTTVVLGSLMQEEEITKTHKFPLLGDLPIVGLVFRQQGRLMQKTETVIFITARFNAVKEK